ncbi:MAG: phosphatase PAP2 family protein [Alphaproteobacteria bacterium]
MVKKKLPLTKALLLSGGLCAISPAHADGWRDIDSPNFLTDQNPVVIHQFLVAGDVFQYLSPALMYGVIASRLDENGFWQGSTTYMATMGTMAVLKNATLRKRPNNANDHQSFPSGHVASVMAPAAFITVRYGFGDALPFWGFGILTAYSRIAGKKHFITDTLGSTGLSLLFAYLFTTPLSDEEKLQKGPKIFLSPTSYDGGGFGMSMAFDF